MPPKKIQIQKKKSIVLVPKSIERVDTGVTSQDPALADAATGMPGAHEMKGATLKVDDEDLRFVEDSGVIDASDSTVVELNSPELKDRVHQIPLEPSRAESTQKLTPPREQSFKFFCYRCGQRLKVPVSWANKSTACGRCGHDLVIPPPLIDDLES